MITANIEGQNITMIVMCRVIKERFPNLTTEDTLKLASSIISALSRELTIQIEIVK